MKKCKTCLLPELAPGASLDSNGVCSYCRDFPQNATVGTKKEEYREDLERTLRAVRNHPGGEYDCLVPFSGGKDSCALLYRLKTEYGLRVLAFTCDIDLPSVAWSNIRTTLNRLNIKHLVVTPPPGFIRKLFRYLLCNQEERGAVYTLSYVYAPLFEGEAIRTAVEKKIPLILAGYSPGQPDPQRMCYEFSHDLIRREDWAPPHLKSCGEFDSESLANFYNPKCFAASTEFPRYLAPYHAWDYDQGHIIREVAELGLVRRKRYASPIFSNYPINWLMMYSDLMHFGYNPYAPEFSALIREGKARFGYWRIMGPLVDLMIRRRIFLGRAVETSLKWLDLRPSDLRICLPQGAYDPPMVRAWRRDAVRTNDS